MMSRTVVKLQNPGIYRIYNPKALGYAAMVLEQSESTTKGLRVINSVVSWVLMSDYRLVIVPLQLLVITKQGENVVAISNIT